MPPHINIMGHRFGKLTVVGEYGSTDSKKRSVCQCDCGGSTVVRNYMLTTGARTCCGCVSAYKVKRRAPDLVGHTFGEYVVTRRLGSAAQGALWEVQCSCGELRKHTTTTLTKGRALKCGKCNKTNTGIFKKKENLCGGIHSTYWLSLSASAQKRGIGLNISSEFAWELFLQQQGKCALSGYPITFARSYTKGNPDQTASLDRIDSFKGYEAGNVQWVHKVVNIMKLNLPEVNFIEWCHRIATHQGLGCDN